MAASSTAISLASDQQQVYDKMPKAWQSKANQALSLVEGVLRTNLLSRHALGDIVREVAGDERRYGEGAVGSLAIVLDDTPQNLWQYRLFAQTYTRPYLEKLLQRSNNSGFKLAWSHMRLLAGVKEAGVRKKLEVDMLAKQLTAEELLKKVQRVLGKRRNTGRKPKAPQSPSAALSQIGKAADSLVERLPTWEETLFEHFDHADTLDSDTLEQIEAVGSTVHRMRAMVADLAVRFDAAIAVARRKTSPATSGNGAAKRQRPDTAAILAGDQKLPKRKVVKKVKRVKKGVKKKRRATASV